eukprot:scaffold4247_cov66-Cylindrotheca_fusiformis.AAC.11
MSSTTSRFLVPKETHQGLGREPSTRWFLDQMTHGVMSFLVLRSRAASGFRLGIPTRMKKSQ